MCINAIHEKHILQKVRRTKKESLKNTQIAQDTNKFIQSSYASGQAPQGPILLGFPSRTYTATEFSREMEIRASSELAKTQKQSEPTSMQDIIRKVYGKRKRAPYKKADKKKVFSIEKKMSKKK